MKKTAVEWIIKELRGTDDEGDFIFQGVINSELIEEAKEMEKENTDNKVIHFAEWLTKTHTLTLIALYEQFEKQEYKHQSNKESL